MGEERARGGCGDDEADRQHGGKDDVVGQQVVLEVDRSKQRERWAQNGAEQRVTGEAELHEAADDERDAQHRDTRRAATGWKQFPQRPARLLDRRRLNGFAHDAHALNDIGLHHPSASRTEMTAGPRMTTNIAGKIMKTSGKRILIGAFCAFPSAAARRRSRISSARLRRISPTDTPSRSPWIMARTNERIADVGHRLSMFSSACNEERPMRCSWIEIRSS